MTDPVEAYALRVSLGELPAGKYHRLACERHLLDLERMGAPDFPYVFDWKEAKRFLDFAGQLRHYKGEWAGQLIKLSPFQVFRLGSVFGWRHRTTWHRRFTTAYNELPRKSGKSLEAAVVAIYATFFEGEPGAEGYCLATKEKQALDVVFRDIKRLIQSSGLRDRLTVQVRNVHQARTQSKLEPLGSDSETLDGLNPHSITTDELHAFKNRGLLDVMESATGARRNPLHYQITTAGSDRVSVCGDQHEYACNVLEGLFDDLSARSFFACIAHADPEDDWRLESTWIKANPHWGISVDPDDMRKLAQKAIAMPSAAAEFQQKRLNLWVNADAPWLSLDGWRTGQTAWTLDEMLGQPCWVGVDLSSKVDLTAIVLAFAPRGDRRNWRLALFAFSPEETLADRAHLDRAPYLVWKDRPMWRDWKTLTTSPGKRINYAQVLDCLKSVKSLFSVQAIGFDPYNAENLQHDLVDVAGFGQNQVVEIAQTYNGMSQAAKDFEADVLDGHVDGGGNPLLAWCVSNAVVQRDGKDNIYPVKKRSRGRIDPVTATLIARAVHRHVGEVKPRAPLKVHFIGARSG
jgi:phage terminase large subunit-like protein